MQVTFSSNQPSPSDPNFAIELVRECLNKALGARASDVHIQPRSDRWEISFRIDGVLQPVGSYERSEQSDPVARLMALAELPTYRGGVPQEGLLRWPSGQGRQREMRIGIFPTVHGNRAAIRIMEDRESVRQFDQLGFDPKTLDALRAFCESRDGWLLVAGPAGSGKTTTLYACLTHIASSQFHRSVLTIEDPIESVIDSISQSQVQNSSGMSLAAAMRAAVRQDAEVLLVSEIRDVETAEAVLAASMTGHLCFSSVHAGSIGGTLRRLVQMKLPEFAIQSGLRAVLCQRLLRKTCIDCAAGDTKRSDRSCQQCQGTGYSGRIPIAQMISFDDSSTVQGVFDALTSGRSAAEIDTIASQTTGGSLYDHAQRLVESGRTDQAEVFRVLGSRK